MTVIPTGLVAPLAPLVPSPDDARGDLRRELLRPEYHQQNPVQEVLAWLDRRLDGLLDATSRAPSLSTVFALVVLVALVLGLALLLSRARRTARAVAPRPVLGQEVVTAAELRRRAQEALAGERFADAVVDGFRALAVRQVEVGVLPDAPGATAHEVAGNLGTERPEHAAAVGAAAALFDEVLYGDRPATAQGARSVLDLDDTLAGRQTVSR